MSPSQAVRPPVSHDSRRVLLRRLFLSVVIGLLAGLAALVFLLCLEWASFWCLETWAGTSLPTPSGERIFIAPAPGAYRPWVLAFLPALGGLVCGLIVYALAPEAAGGGIDPMIDAFHNQGGRIRKRVPYVKGLATIAILASGGSAGREGPIAQIGAGFGSWLAGLLRLPDSERRVFLLAGCAAGIGAIFRAPLGAAITSIEVLYREDYESEAIIPCVISAVIAYSLFTYFFGFAPIFALPRLAFGDPRELLVYGALGLLCWPAAALYQRVFTRARTFFAGLSLPIYLRPMLGGLAVGVLALAVPQALGAGWGWIEQAATGRLDLTVMLLAAGAKILATSLSVGSGGSGGIFGPTLFIGGMLGGTVGLLGQALWPAVVTQPGAYVLVGMAGYCAAVVKNPLGAMFLVAEMSQSHGLLPPLMLVSVIAMLLNRGPGLFQRQVRNKFASPAHRDELTVDVLRGMTVSQVFQPDQAYVKLRSDTRFAELRSVIAASRQYVFPVVDEGQRLIGVLPLKNVRNVMFEDSLGDLVVVGELAAPPVSLTLDQDLNSALVTFLQSGYNQIPVVESQDGGQRLLGMLSHEDVIAAYHAEVSRRTQAE
ncbi:MAG: chloride channel protein [Desulfarculus sp.]|nr:chloride channel protein [Desulfarculus sp.]